MFAVPLELIVLIFPTSEFNPILTDTISSVEDPSTFKELVFTLAVSKPLVSILDTASSGVVIKVSVLENVSKVKSAPKFMVAVDKLEALITEKLP